MARDDRWIEVSKSTFAHEAEGLDYLRRLIPDSSPYRVWTNFEFMDNHGGWNEIDALVLGRRRLHMVELKSYTGLLTGNERTWTLTGLSRHSRTQRSALLTTRHKAQKLASRLKEQARKVALENGLDPDKVLRALPFIQECVFFHGEQFAVDLSDLATSNLFSFDDRTDQTGLPGIAERLLEPPAAGREPTSEDLSVILALAMRELAGSQRTDRDAGSWNLTGSATAAAQDWQEFDAVHKVTGEHGRARIVTTRRGAPPQARAAAHRRLEREFTLLSGLRQEAIVPPRELTIDDDGNTVIIYDPLPGYEPLDLAVATRTLTAEQRVTVLLRVAEALAYAHRNQVANRGLSPNTVLIDTETLDGTGEVEIRLADWSWAGRIHSAHTPPSTLLGSAISGNTSDADVYQAPEDRWSPNADRVAVDVFSLGALAYYVLAGEPPAHTRSELITRLRTENGLDLAASGGGFVDERLRELVLHATRPQVSERLDRPKDDSLAQFGAEEFRAQLEQYSSAKLTQAEPEPDPLNPIPEAELADGRFEVVKVLGTGSTARGVLVLDNHHDRIRRVLKVGLDDAAAARLHEEAEVLTHLGELDPKVPGVVELLEPPLHITGRTALLLTDGGEQTLSDLVRYMVVGEANLKAWGTQLLDTVVALDAAGIAHRDIKPSNLGMARIATKGKRTSTRLMLFDFSLSRAGVTAIDAGTPPYRDPFLGTGTRTAFDSAAERYSAAVVLYQMATASTPEYGDGLSDPRAINDDVTVDVDDFLDAGLPEHRAAALADFFRTALARDARRRHDTAAAMREAWKAVFAATETPAATQDDKRDETARRATEVIVLDADLPAHPPYTSLRELVHTLAATAGRKPTVMRRKVLELVLGTRDDAPADPFVVYGDLAARAEVTPGRVAQIFGEFPSFLDSDHPLREPTARRLKATIVGLRERTHTLLLAAGGASTPTLLARDLIADLRTDGVDDPQRVALGLLRYVLACDTALTGDDAARIDAARIDVVRRQGTGTVAMLATSPDYRRLPATLAHRAEQLIDDARTQGLALVGVAEADAGLRAEAARTLGVEAAELEIGGHILRAIAAAASPEVELTSRGELHGADLLAEHALRLVLHGVSETDSLGRTELATRLAARFPALHSDLPRRPKLDDLVAAAAPGLAWDDDLARYRFPSAPAAKGSTIPTHRTTHPAARPAVSSSRVDGLGAGERRFRALGVPLGRSDAVADALAARFGAVRIDVTDVILEAMRRRAAEVGLPWDKILAADAGGAADREGLRGFVTQAVPAVVDAVAAVDGPVVLTDLSTLAAYGQLGVIGTWTDLAAPPPHSVWAVIPQPHAAGSGPLVDGVALPLNSPEQFVPLTEDDVKAVTAKEPTA